MENIYTTGSGIIATPISGGRSHYPHRLVTRAVSSYPYVLTYGDNFHTLSMAVFGDDSYWWILSDINNPMDSFSLQAGDTIKLPNSLAKEIPGITKFF